MNTLFLLVTILKFYYSYIYKCITPSVPLYLGGKVIKNLSPFQCTFKNNFSKKNSIVVIFKI